MADLMFNYSQFQLLFWIIAFLNYKEHYEIAKILYNTNDYRTEIKGKAESKLDGKN